MRVRLLITLLLIAALPLGVLVWSGLRMARDERMRVEARFRDVTEARLREVRSTLDRVVAAWAREVAAVSDSGEPTPDACRAAARTMRLVRQVFVMDADGRLVHPSGDEALLTEHERAFLMRTRSLWANGETFYRDADSAKGASAASSGWHTWFWDDGLNILRWNRLSSGRIVGVELNRAALTADLIAALPVTEPGYERATEGQIRLVEAGGGTVYEWGSYSPPANADAFVRLPLHQPFGSWSLLYFRPPEADPLAAMGPGRALSLSSGIVAVVVAVLLLVVYFYRESARDMREASQRVSFVNQVSHELKTPLTNIRLYAEMLAERLAEADPKARRQADVVVTESRRLSRLISNVLTFAREQRCAVEIRKAPGVVDDCVRTVLAHFAPALASKGIEVAFEAGASERVMVDKDALEQILGNLVGNVEKYAASGKRMVVSSGRSGDIVTVAVRDWGPGIPRSHRDRVFQPFVRLSNRLNDGVAGTGIGLGIARDLARHHGGDVTVEDADPGARFIVRLRAEPVAS